MPRVVVHCAFLCHGSFRGTVGGVFFSIGEVGGFPGPFLMGYLRDATGSFF